MDFEEPTENTKKRSLGVLRKAPKTKPRSPDLTGQLKLQRHTMEAILKQFEITEIDEVICNTGAHDYRGAYVTVELSPRFVSTKTERSRPSLIDFILNDQEEE